MSHKESLLYSYLLPILLATLLLVVSVLIGLVGLSNLLTAAALFVTIGLSIFFAELLIAKTSRISERKDMYALVTNLLFRNRSGSTNMGDILSLHEVLAIEAIADEVWVYAYDLGWESEGSNLPDLVLSNLKRGVKYRYIVPNTKHAGNRVNALRHKYSSVKDVDRLIKYKSRQRDLKLVQFGIGIYNPSLLSRDSRSVTDCVVIFYPHYSAYGPKNDNPVFVTLRGQSTVEIQEGFYELWNEADEVLITKSKGI
jgi:hypothetical protein